MVSKTFTEKLFARNKAVPAPSAGEREMKWQCAETGYENRLSFLNST